MNTSTLTDKSQFQANAILYGQHKLSGVDQELMEWITKQFGVRALDFFCERKERTKGVPQQLIHVILETKDDVKQMQSNRANTTAVTERFLKYLQTTNTDNPTPDSLKSNVFSSETNPFPQIVITYRPLKSLDNKIAREMFYDERGEMLKVFECVWTVSQYVVFYYTDAQIKENLANGISTKITEELERIDKKYGFGQSTPYRFDSKEYFDGGCESKWHYYWK